MLVTTSRTGVSDYTSRSLVAASLVLAAALGADLLARAADRAAADPTAFTVGILRRDAIIVPFATDEGRKWRADWPVARADHDVPVDLRSVPTKWWGPIGPRETWQAWVDQHPPRVLTVLQPDWFPTYCLRGIGLRTDYRAREPMPPPGVRPYPTDGLVVSPPRVIERIAAVPPDDPARARLAPAIRDAFNRTEREIGSREHHPVRRADREKVDPIIEAVYAAADRRVVYVEAAREYRGHADPASACEAIAFGGGWFVRGADDRYTPLQTYVTVLDCDRDGASYMLPLGLVRVSDRTFWLAQFSGWDAEQYEVDEIKPRTVTPIVSRFGGGC
jgi:hypothetical protein